MREPRKAASVWAEMPFMHGPKGAERMHELRPILAAAHEDAQTRRTRVLAHDWAAKRLCLIFGYDRAEQWTGFVPPELTAEGGRNTSALRAALIELLDDVYAEEAA